MERAMDKWIAEENIARYEKMLAVEQSDEQRNLIEKLLADERAKLKRLSRSRASQEA